LIAVRGDFGPELLRIHDALDPAGRYEGRTRDQMFMTAFLQHLIDAGIDVGAVRVAGGWVEVDTLDDLAAYESLYQSGELRRYVALPGG
jgi:NDP-sugar pyrophosphorylase family protein